MGHRVVHVTPSAADDCDGLHWERVAGVRGLVSPELSDAQFVRYLKIPGFVRYEEPDPEPSVPATPAAPAVIVPPVIVPPEPSTAPVARPAPPMPLTPSQPPELHRAHRAPKKPR